MGDNMRKLIIKSFRSMQRVVHPCGAVGVPVGVPDEKIPATSAVRLRPW
jgi:hypothetical protein